jgi:CDP-diacylglycerol--glycerol-3-phosphate 3-phosphatidyltransferase
MFTNLGRQVLANVLVPIASFVQLTGISPNVVTVVGFCLATVAAVFIAQGQFLTGGIVLLISGIFDALDGTLARVAGRVSRYGAFLDSTIDRYSEAVLCLGLLIYYNRLGNQTEVILVYLTIIGSLLVSYTRARAEGIGISCKVGIFTRAERWITLSLGLLLNQMVIALWVLAVLSNLTALQRIYAVWRSTGGERGG